MTSYDLNFLTKNKTLKPSVRLVINTFSGSPIEYDQSNEMIRILGSKKIKLTEILDINQEMIFESEMSKINLI